LALKIRAGSVPTNKQANERATDENNAEWTIIELVAAS